MKRRCCVLLVLFFMAVMPGVVFANNIAVANVSLVDRVPASDTYDIQFNISWANSWRIAGAPSAIANWDAAWVFAKYSVYDSGTAAWGEWKHCTLNASGSPLPTGFSAGTGTGLTINVPTDKTGGFLYRTSADTGTVTTTGIKFVWYYGSETPAVADDAIIKVKVFAIEMVYIPTCNFYVGDGTNRTGGSNSHFFDAADIADPRDPVLISSTQPWISPHVDGVAGTAGDITWVNESTYAGNLPAARTQLGASYPTGYNAFYIMKYEISQAQYRDFLNTLTKDQQTNRVAEIATASDYAMTDSTTVTYRDTIRLPSSIPGSGPVTFGCDYASNSSAGDGTFDQSDDGEWIACNYLSWMDGCAYADWAALRPFTELEFEKACRGGQTVLAGEYAWRGSATPTDADTLANGGSADEGVTETGDGLCNYNNDGVLGPLRCGFAATTTPATTRSQAGAGYYGIMELSGNLWERPVSVMDSQTGTTVSTFDGTHGDGTLSSTGFATNSNWPGTDAQGGGFRGGHWSSDATLARVSDRYIAAYANTYRYHHYGGRCARTSP